MNGMQLRDLLDRLCDAVVTVRVQDENWRVQGDAESLLELLMREWLEAEVICICVGECGLTVWIELEMEDEE